MKFSAKQAIQTGLILLVLAGPLWGQAKTDGQSDPGQSQSSNTSSSRPHDSAFIIGNDDLLAINVWKEPDLSSKSIPVRSDGKISLPLVGEIQAAGRTPLQLEQDIESKLKSFITTPEVTVMVEQVNSRKFNILGQVAKPGSYSLSLGSNVMDAIAAAGGLKDFAKKTGIYILRKGPSGQESRIGFNYKDFIKGKNQDQNIKLEPNDTIIVP